MKIDAINKKFYIKFTRKVVNQISHISYKGKMIAPYASGKRMLMNKEVTIYCNTSGEIYTLYNGQKAYFKEITNVLVPESKNPILRKIEFEKRKMISYNKQVEMTKQTINNKIAELEKVGVYIDRL